MATTGVLGLAPLKKSRSMSSADSSVVTGDGATAAATAADGDGAADALVDAPRVSRKARSTDCDAAGAGGLVRLAAVDIVGPRPRPSRSSSSPVEAEATGATGVASTALLLLPPASKNDRSHPAVAAVELGPLLAGMTGVPGLLTGPPTPPSGAVGRLWAAMGAKRRMQR